MIRFADHVPVPFLTACHVLYVLLISVCVCWKNQPCRGLCAYVSRSFQVKSDESINCSCYAVQGNQIQIGTAFMMCLDSGIA